MEINVKNLSFCLRKNMVLNDITLHIPEGKVTTIMGANGCGKSTLFSLMTKNLIPGKGGSFSMGKILRKSRCRSLPERWPSSISIIRRPMILLWSGSWLLAGRPI